jgi:hypothetical protein
MSTPFEQGLIGYCKEAGLSKSASNDIVDMFKAAGVAENADGIKESTKSIVQSIKEYFSDPEVQRKLLSTTVGAGIGGVGGGLFNQGLLKGRFSEGVGPGAALGAIAGYGFNEYGTPVKKDDTPVKKDNNDVSAFSQIVNDPKLNPYSAANLFKRIDWRSDEPGLPTSFWHNYLNDPLFETIGSRAANLINPQREYGVRTVPVGPVGRRRSNLGAPQPEYGPRI